MRNPLSARGRNPEEGPLSARQQPQTVAFGSRVPATKQPRQPSGPNPSSKHLSHALKASTGSNGSLTTSEDLIKASPRQHEAPANAGPSHRSMAAVGSMGVPLLDLSKLSQSNQSKAASSSGSQATKLVPRLKLERLSNRNESSRWQDESSQPRAQVVSSLPRGSKPQAASKSRSKPRSVAPAQLLSARQVGPSDRIKYSSLCC